MSFKKNEISLTLKPNTTLNKYSKKAPTKNLSRNAQD